MVANRRMRSNEHRHAHARVHNAPLSVQSAVNVVERWKRKQWHREKRKLARRRFGDILVPPPAAEAASAREPGDGVGEVTPTCRDRCGWRLNWCVSRETQECVGKRDERVRMRREENTWTNARTETRTRVLSAATPREGPRKESGGRGVGGTNAPPPRLPSLFPFSTSCITMDTAPSPACTPSSLEERKSALRAKVRCMQSRIPFPSAVAPPPWPHPWLNPSYDAGRDSADEWKKARPPVAKSKK